ncbi:hypothetical protein BV898_17896 [Hypsibius exemplaris]|uniref:Uncharacterized protein n=1 Tax=Hypsibius exemplaris TaxID=2072580 RepID=A0A9X6NIR0_HYPEX|nr:hypothetical protein BV898_17896 [Hypsibius exemplaris]
MMKLGVAVAAPATPRGDPAMPNRLTGSASIEPFLTETYNPSPDGLASADRRSRPRGQFGLFEHCLAGAL